MDKAQAQILFLVLIAVAFIGQAIHDFIKKNRANYRPTTKRQAQRTAPTRAPKTNLEGYRPLKTTEKPKQEPILQSDILDEIQESVSTPETNVSKSETRGSNIASGSDELRKAVIWSEILKRKF